MQFKKKEKKQDLFYTIVRIKREHGFQGLSTDLAPGVGGGGWEGVLNRWKGCLLCDY